MEINPRKISAEKLKALAVNIEKFNVVEIPVIDVDNHLLTYHQRLKALLMIGRGEDMIDVRIPNRKLTELEIKEYNLIANTHSGEFDMELFNEFFSDVSLEDIGLNIEDFDIAEKLKNYSNEIKEEVTLVAKEDDFNIPREIQTDVVLGDFIEIGEHRLICGDIMDTDLLEKLTSGKKFDLVVTDPPYNVDYEGEDGMKIMNDKMKDAEFYQFLYDRFLSLALYTKDGGGWYVWHADSEGLNFRKAFIESGIMLKQCIIWVKNSIVMGRQDYHWKHEPCLYGWKPGAAHYFTDERDNSTVYDDKQDFAKLRKDELLNLVKSIFSDKTKSSILYHNKPTSNDLHPTMKPVTLIADLIKNSSKQLDIVADGFLGSGTTMVAAHQLNRKCYGMELDPKYCQVIVDRMRKLDPTIQIKKNGVPI